MEYGTIKIPMDAYERHNEARKRLGLTWEEYVDDEAPDIEPQGAAIPADVREQLDRIESAAQTAEDRAGSIERAVEDMEGRMR
jgi:hypothetical protein